MSVRDDVQPVTHHDIMLSYCGFGESASVDCVDWTPVETGQFSDTYTIRVEAMVAEKVDG